MRVLMRGLRLSLSSLRKHACINMSLISICKYVHCLSFLIDVVSPKATRWEALCTMLKLKSKSMLSVQFKYYTDLLKKFLS